MQHSDWNTFDPEPLYYSMEVTTFLSSVGCEVSANTSVSINSSHSSGCHIQCFSGDVQCLDALDFVSEHGPSWCQLPFSH